jgi:hypothetical protein
MRIIIKEFLIKLVAPDYYEIKKQNRQMHNDIYALIEGEPFQKISVEMRWKYLFELERGFYRGEVNNITHFNGFESRWKDA